MCWFVLWENKNKKEEGRGDNAVNTDSFMLRTLWHAIDVVYAKVKFAATVYEINVVFSSGLQREDHAFLI